MKVERLVGLETVVHDGAYGVNHGHGRVTLEDVSPHVYARGFVGHGAMGHFQGEGPHSPSAAESSRFERARQPSRVVLDLRPSSVLAGPAHFRTTRPFAAEVLALHHQLGVLNRSVNPGSLLDRHRVEVNVVARPDRDPDHLQTS